MLLFHGGGTQFHHLIGRKDFVDVQEHCDFTSGFADTQNVIRIDRSTAR